MINIACSLAMLLLITATGASAATTSTTSSSKGSTIEGSSTSTASVPSSSTEPSPFRFTFSSFFWGPPVSDLGADQTATGRQDYTVGLSLQNQLAVQYRFNENLMISPVLDFEYLLTDPHNQGIERSFSLTYDSFIKARYSDLVRTKYNGNTVTLDGELRYYVPISEFSRTNDSYGSIRLALNPWVKFGDSGFSLYMVNFFRYWIQTRYFQLPTTLNPVARNTVGLPEYTFYTGPQLSYRINERFTAWLLFEASMTINTLGANDYLDPRRSNTDLEPGVDIRVTDTLSISPYLNWYTNQPISTTSINLITSVAI